MLGFLDFLSLIAMVLLVNGAIPWRVGMIFAAYLLIKGFAFKGDFASVVDMTIGVYIILIPVFSVKFFTIIFAIYLGQKAFVSLF